MFLAILLLLTSPVRADEGTFGPQTLADYCASMSSLAASYRADASRYDAEAAECLDDPHCSDAELAVLRLMADNARASWIETRRQAQLNGCVL